MLKYGRSNWRVAGVRASIYYDAAKRHLNAWFEGEDADPDSGLPHLAHVLACCAILVDAEAAHKLTDDRMVRGGYRPFIDQMTAHVARLKKKHADRNPKHYTIKDNDGTGKQAYPSREQIDTFDRLSRKDAQSIPRRDPGYVVLGPQGGLMDRMEMVVDPTQATTPGLVGATEGVATGTERRGADCSGGRRFTDRLRVVSGREEVGKRTEYVPPRDED